MSYPIRRQPTLATRKLRDLEFQLYRWEGESARPLVLAHGWGDSGETFQFVVDHLPPRQTIIAYDARGFGRTEWPQDGYWFPDYLADLEAVIDSLSPHDPIDLVGHSMGGNVAMLYAGIRPQRVRRLVNLEGFGLPATTPDRAPARYREWLDELRDGTSYATYDDFEQFEKVLARRNPRTSAESVAFIARSWAKRRADGRVELRSDPRHKRVNPMLYQRDQVEACWREIIAPVLFVAGGLSEHAQRTAQSDFAVRFPTLFRALTVATVADAGHMLHHERPAELAELIEQFCRLSLHRKSILQRA
jgi:pimeloyl-ACP methyl ester carboxylesterase